MSFKEVNALRKSGKLDEALQIAESDLEANKNDQWCINALYWVLNDCCKIAIDNNDQNVAEEYILKLQNIVKKGLSDKMQHEALGWNIYRYLLAAGNYLSSVRFRTFMRDYIVLKNERPSVLHSAFINLALKVCDRFIDFNLIAFIKLWDVRYFRKDDVCSKLFDGKQTKPLVSRILKKLAEKPDLNVKEIVDVFKESPMLTIPCILDDLREFFYWKLFNAAKNKDLSIWEYYNNYLFLFEGQPASVWNSKILDSACWSMCENESWRFYSFFIRWNPANLRYEDWQKIEIDGNTYNSLAHKAICKSFDCVQKSHKGDDISYLITLFDKAINLQADDIQMYRKKALLLYYSGRISEANDIYVYLLPKLDEWYVWHEFSKITTETSLIKIAFLSKAVLKGKQECFIGEVRLDLAEQFILSNQPERAALELSLYKNYRLERGWKISDRFEILHSQIGNTTSVTNNIDLYKSFARKADEFMYNNLEVFIGFIEYNNENKKVLHIVSSDSNLFFYRYESLKFNVGDFIQFNLIEKKILGVDKLVPVNIRLSEKDKVIQAFPHFKVKVSWVNTEKGIFHFVGGKYNEGVVHFKEIEYRPKAGESLCLHVYEMQTKNGNKFFKVLKATPVVNFNKHLA